MKRYSVHKSLQAARDLDMVVAYLVDTLKNPRAAEELLDGYENLLDSLEQMPTAHTKVRDGMLSLAGYYWAPVSSYMVFFTIDEQDSLVHIHRIAHNKRNWANLV